MIWQVLIPTERRKPRKVVSEFVASIRFRYTNFFKLSEGHN